MAIRLHGPLWKRIVVTAMLGTVVRSKLFFDKRSATTAEVVGDPWYE